MRDERQHADRDDRDRARVTQDDAGAGGAAGSGSVGSPREADLELGGTESHRRASFADPIPPGDPDGVLGPRDDAPRDE